VSLNLETSLNSATALRDKMISENQHDKAKAIQGYIDTLKNHRGSN
jgi:hypothetical protein